MFATKIRLIFLIHCSEWLDICQKSIVTLSHSYSVTIRMGWRHHFCMANRSINTDYFLYLQMQIQSLIGKVKVEL